MSHRHETESPDRVNAELQTPDTAEAGVQAELTILESPAPCSKQQAVKVETTDKLHSNNKSCEYLPMESRKSTHTQNSLMYAVAGIHGRFMSIICAGVLAFYMYNYQQVETCKLRLDELRLRTARTMRIPAFYDPCGVNPTEYFDANELNIRKVVTAFYDQLGYNPDSRTEVLLGASGINVAEAFGYRQRVTHLISLINIVANIDPYSTRSRQTSPGLASVMYSDLRKDWTQKWQNDLGELNFELTLLLRQRRDAVEDLLRRYDEARVKDEMARLNTSSANDSFDIHRVLGTEFRTIIERFFSAVEVINENILPELNDYAFRLNRHQTRLQDRQALFNTLSPLVLLLFSGIIVPLVLSLKPLYSRWPTIIVLIISAVPYIWLSLFLFLR